MQIDSAPDPASQPATAPAADASAPAAGQSHAGAGFDPAGPARRTAPVLESDSDPHSAAGPARPMAPGVLSEPPTFGLGQIAQIAIPVKDLDRAVAFYRDALGMRYLFQVQALAFFDAAGVRIMLAAPEAQGDGDDRRSSMLYFTVKDIDHAQRALRARGVQFIRDAHLVARMADHDLWMAFLEDSEGNALGLVAEVRQ